jgi:hypothetical protein
MNRHPGLFSHALLSGILLLLTASAATVCGQTAPAPAPTAAPAGNLDAVKNASPAPAAPINAYIQAQIAAMANGDAATAAKVRDEIVDQVSAGKVAPSPSFLNAFATALDAGIAPALQNQSYQVRLNAAIAHARVAERTQDAAMVNSTIALLNDPSPFVALWGLKSARFILPAVLKNPVANANTLTAAIIKAAQAHGAGPIGSAIIVEAYEALVIDNFDADAKRRPAGPALTKVIPAMQQLLGQRVGAYKNGVPPEPIADARATLFLTDSRVWPQHTPAQKLASMQLMSDLIGLAAQQAQAAGPGDLGTTIGRVAQAIAVVPETASIAAQLEAAKKIDARTPPPQILQTVSEIPAALKTLKPFATLTPPPTASTGGGAAATQPGAAATTGAAGAAGTTAPAASSAPAATAP